MYKKQRNLYIWRPEYQRTCRSIAQDTRYARDARSERAQHRFLIGILISGYQKELKQYASFIGSHNAKPTGTHTETGVSTMIEQSTEISRSDGREASECGGLLTTDYMGMCPHCNGLVAIAKADTPQEEADALTDAAGWKRRGLDIYKRTHKTTDPMPHWCNRKCG